MLCAIALLLPAAHADVVVSEGTNLHVDVAPDGDAVYVTSFLDDAIAIFARSATTGALSFIDAIQNGSGGVTDFDAPRALVLSPDGSHAYAVTSTGFLATFVRNPINGFLSNIDSFSNSFLVQGIGAPSDVAISRGGDFVAVASSDDNLAIFARSSATGLLSSTQVETHGIDGIFGLEGASGVEFSPLTNRLDLLVTGGDSDALSLFVPEPGSRASMMAGLLLLALITRPNRLLRACPPDEFPRNPNRPLEPLD